MLSDPVAEAFGLIHRHPSCENFFRVCVCLVGTRHKIALKNRNVFCVVKLIHTKTVKTKTRKHQNVQTVGGPMLPITEVVLYTRIKLLGNMWSKSNFLCLHCKTSFTTTPQQHIYFHSRTNCIPGNKCGLTNRSATIVYQKFA